MWSFLGWHKAEAIHPIGLIAEKIRNLPSSSRCRSAAARTLQSGHRPPQCWFDVIEHAMIVSHGPRLEIGRLGTHGDRTAKSLELEDVESAHIISVLESTSWRIRGRGGAAELLGLKPTPS